LSFVDECHRTQERENCTGQWKGQLCRTRFFIVLTGHPLLKNDKQNKPGSLRGATIHTYKFCEAVEDKVVLDLVYEAREHPTQRLGSEQKIDAWF